MLTFHHHMGTVVQNPDEVKRLMENTEPEYVSLLFDTGHFAYCGADPLEMAKTYMHRIRHVHLKDIRPEIVQEVRKKKRSFLDGVRMGHLPYRETELLILNRYFRFWNVLDMKVYVVEAEQDPAKANPFEYALKARKFIREKTGTCKAGDNPLDFLRPLLYHRWYKRGRVFYEIEYTCWGFRL